MTSMPCFRVTLTMPHPWHPPPSWTNAIESFTPTSATHPPCEATAGLIFSAITFSIACATGPSGFAGPALGASTLKPLSVRPST
jgi:hypothetical protein